MRTLVKSGPYRVLSSGVNFSTQNAITKGMKIELTKKELEMALWAVGNFEDEIQPDNRTLGLEYQDYEALLRALEKLKARYYSRTS